MLGQQLKVLRALQLGVNAQTARLDAGAVGADERRSQASRLAERQGDLVGVARSLELDDVAAGMEKAQGLLKDGETGEPVRSVQAGVVAQLDALIASYEEQSQRSAPGQPQQAAKPSPKGGAETPTRAAQESAVPPGDWRHGRLAEAAQLPGGWAPGLPPSEQKKIADTFSTGRLPGRYAELLREYNKRLAAQATP